MFKAKKIKRMQIKIFIWTFLCALLTNTLAAQDFNSYHIYNNKSKKTKIKKLLKEVDKADVVFFGEMHNDPISHWLELKIFKYMEERGPVVLGLEMFERDQQRELDKYMSGEIELKALEENIKLWSNYKTDYAPIIDYAKANNINTIATNIPRRYASLVYKEGFEVLEGMVDEEKVHFAPLPIDYDPELESYKKMANMIEGHGGENFPKSQAIKDATMAYSISETFEPGAKYLHLNGAYHSDAYQGIVWYLKRYKENLKILTITVLTGDETSSDDLMKGEADFIIRVDGDMIKTY